MTNYVILLRNNNFSRLPNKIDYFQQETPSQEAGVRRLFLFILPFPHTLHPTPHTPLPHHPTSPSPHT
ncbi:hypothetical protein PN439_06470, partial [Microcystis aeruginosa CS-583]|nr:hypothetical protein [Microcystis aeruginosa CS-583]